MLLHAPPQQPAQDYVSLGGNDSSVGKQQDSAQPEVRMTPQQQLEAMLQQAAAAGAAQALSAYMVSAIVLLQRVSVLHVQ